MKKSFFGPLIVNPYTPVIGIVGRLSICLFAFLVVAGIATIDSLIGLEYSLSLLYLIPVGITTWYINRQIGVGFSLLSTFAIVLEQATFSIGHVYSAPIAWQGLVHLSFMLTFVWFVHCLRMVLEKQERFASIDSLTGLMNRRAFLDRLNYVLRLATRERIPVSLAYIDLDNFKQVNDLHGHDAGDRLLQSVANTFTHSIRSSDVAGRLGGDEFVILLPDTDSHQAQHFAYKLWYLLVSFLAVDGTSVTCSMGCITFVTPPSDAESALKAGDKLMYESKRSGKNRISFSEWH